MDELIKLVVEKTGISEEMAKVAVNTVIEFLKERLPEPLAGRLDDVIEGADLTGIGDLVSGLGGLLGGK
jgi:hypothetical protein